MNWVFKIFTRYKIIAKARDTASVEDINIDYVAKHNLKAEINLTDTINKFYITLILNIYII